MPEPRALAEELELEGIDDELERAVIVAAGAFHCICRMSEGPDIAGKGLGEIAGFRNDGVQEDLHFVVGDEIVAESGKVESEGNKEEESEVEKRGAAVRGHVGKRCGGGSSRGGLRDGVGGEFFAASGHGKVLMNKV